MSTPIYAWKGGYTPRVPASIAGPVIDRIRRKHDNYFSPSALVNESRPVKAPLHAEFEWDDSIAAEEHRRAQAQGLIRHLVVVNHAQVDGPTVRAFVSVRVDGGEGRPVARYTSMAHALSRPDLRAQILMDALRDMRSFQAKYADLAEVAGVLTEMLRVRGHLAESIGSETV